VKHLENNTLINETQHGFRRGRSCLTNLLVFLDELTRAVDVIYLHFARRLTRSLISVLSINSGNMDGKVLEWITAWLSNRKQ